MRELTTKLPYEMQCKVTHTYLVRITPPRKVFGAVYYLDNGEESVQASLSDASVFTMQLSQWDISTASRHSFSLRASVPPAPCLGKRLQVSSSLDFVPRCVLM